MKNQSIILMLSFTALSGDLAAHAMDERELDRDLAHPSGAQQPSDLQFALVNDIDSRRAHKEDGQFKAAWDFLDEEDRKAKHALERLLAPSDTEMDAVSFAIQSSLDPLSPPGIEGAKGEASLLKASDNLDGRDTRREDDAEAERLIAAFAKDREEEAQREEKKRLLERETIYDLCPRIFALREQEKEASAKASKALRAYIFADVGMGYIIVGSAEAPEAEPEGSDEERAGKAKEAWEALATEHDAVSSRLYEAIARRDSLLDDQYFSSMQEKEGKGWVERIREVRSRITALQQEVKAKRTSAVDASGEAYGEPEEPGAPDEERKSGQETPNDLEAEATRAQLALEAAINEETNMISGYLAALHDPDFPLT